MESCSSKVLESARSYRKLLCSHVKKGETEPDNCEKKSETVKCESRWGYAKPRASRKRKQFWIDSENKENKVSENSKTTEELNHVKKFKSTLSWQGLVEKVKKRRLQGLEEKERKRELQKQNLAKQLPELEEGEIPPSGSPSPENCFCSTSDKSDIEEETNGETKRQTVFDILKDLEEGEIPTLSRCSKDSFHRISKEGKISIDGEIIGKETERPVIMADDHNRQKGIPQKNLGTSSMDKEQQKADNEIVRLGKKIERSITMVNDCNFETEIPQKSNRTSKLTPCSSDSEIKAGKIQRTSKESTCSGSPNVPAHAPDEMVIDIDSDTDSDVVELIDQKSVTSTSNVKNNEVSSSFNGIKDGVTNNEVSSSFNGIKDGVTRSNSVEKPSPEDPQSTIDEVAMDDQTPECSPETIPASNIQNTEVNSYPFEDSASGSTSLEKHSSDKNIEKVDSMEKSSENLQISSHEVLQEQSVPMEVANIPESQDKGVVPPVCLESNLHFTGTSTSVVPPDVRAVQNTSITLNQAPLSSPSSSSQSGSLQCLQNIGRYTSSPEVQASPQPFSGEAVQLSTPSMVDLQQPQLRNVTTNGNATHFHEPGSRTNGPDIRTIAASLASTSANLSLPGRSQPLSYDPLQNELDRLQKNYDQELKKHEAMMLNMRCRRDEAIEEIMKKYEVLFQEAEAAMQCNTREYKAKFLQVYLNNLVANTWIFKEKECQGASTPGTRQASPNLINVVQNPTPQMSTVRLDQHSPVTVPFRPVIINQPSPVPVRPFSGHMVPQNGYQFRVATPHLRASRPPMHSPVANCSEFIQQMQMSPDDH